VPPGAVAYHHGLTFHLAGANRTGTVRRVHTVIYFADGSTRGEGRFPHPSVERAGIGLAEVIASDVTPLACGRMALPSRPRTSIRTVGCKTRHPAHVSASDREKENQDEPLGPL